MLTLICLWCLQKLSVSFCTNFHSIKPERSFDLNNILGFINSSFMNLFSRFTCRFHMHPTGKRKHGKLYGTWLVSHHCLGVDGLGGWVRMWGGTMLSITWGCGHTCSWDPCLLCLLLPTSECELKVDAYSFRQRQNLMQELSKLGGKKWEETPKPPGATTFYYFPSTTAG